jgi:hypothetical protein
MWRGNHGCAERRRRRRISRGSAERCRCFEIHALDEIRRDNPYVSDAELVRMIVSSAEERASRAFREGVRLAMQALWQKRNLPIGF